MGQSLWIPIKNPEAPAVGLDKAWAFEKETKEKYHNVSFMWEYIKYAKTQRKYWEAELKYWQKQLL